MAEAKQRSDWSHTSALLAMLFNINRGKNVQPKKPYDFNPFVARSKSKGNGIPLNKDTIKQIKKYFKP